jgi:sensor histidine kinase YesM
MTGHRTENPDSGNVWPLIWSVGGLFWAVVAIIEIVAFWHASGTMMDGEYVPTSPARGLSFILQFIMAACVYRVALAKGWPQGPYARARVIAIQIFLALVFVRCAPAAYYLAAAVVDGLTEELRDNLKHLQSFQWSYSDWAWALRLSVPRYALGLVLVALVKVAREYHRETLRSASLSMEYANTRLAMLSAQLQPHFLFNALHTIAELVDQNPARATTMLARLGDFLRHALETSKQRWVSVLTEIAGIEAYLAVQQARFGDRLQVHIAVDAAAARLAIPSLLLQPLVENAVDHGRGGPDELLMVRIVVRCDGARLHVVVTNSRPRLTAPLPRSAYGYGLGNVEARMKAAYAEAATLTVGPAPDEGTQAEVILPAHTRPIDEPAAVLPPASITADARALEETTA